MDSLEERSERIGQGRRRWRRMKNLVDGSESLKGAAVNKETRFFLPSRRDVPARLLRMSGGIRCSIIQVGKIYE